jgi:biopolymer transport protein ExbD
MRYFEQRRPRIEIIPMIDIMFFLLVFFIMATLKMIPADGIESQLPRSSSTQELPPPTVMVTVQASGDLVVDDHPMTVTELTAHLAAQPDHDKATVTVAGAQTVTLQTLLSVIDSIRASGVSRFNLAAKPAAE